jgi:hypothetical protein
MASADRPVSAGMPVAGQDRQQRALARFLPDEIHRLLVGLIVAQDNDR